MDEYINAPYSCVQAVLEETAPLVQEDTAEVEPPMSLSEALIQCRLAHYSPEFQDVTMRKDIVCLGCGRPYRPDDIEDDLNCLVCHNCIRNLEEKRS